MFIHQNKMRALKNKQKPLMFSYIYPVAQICFVYEFDPTCINVHAFSLGAFQENKSAHINTG
jgi:hypothetical protein